ncbi:quinone oxidoreductase [Myxococcaceae bacterium GXIMD 01537]
MKAVRYYELGGPEVLRWEDAPEPHARAGEARIRVHAAGVNFADTERRRGLYDATAPLPGIPGYEVSGVVDEVGPGVAADWVGRRVVARAPNAYAEWTTAPLTDVFELHAGIPFDVGAALLVQGLTAYHLVHTVGQLKSGQTVLIHAAAGGVGLLAVQLAKSVGARVLGTVSSESKAELARRFGADDTIRYEQTDFATEVQRLTQGRGVELVLDAVGARTWEGSLKVLSPFGHLVVYGSASGAPPPLDLERLFANSLKVSSYWLRTPHPPELQRAAMDFLMKEVAEGRLRIELGLKLPLKEAAEAHRRLEGRETVGKVVLEVR